MVERISGGGGRGQGKSAREFALSVEVLDGEIVLRDPLGPSAVALTPAAAEETAKRLSAAVRTADEEQLSQRPPSPRQPL